MTAPEGLSWGKYPRAAQRIKDIFWQGEAETGLQQETFVLPRGNGRSYGDVCLNDAGGLLRTTSLDRFIAFDRDSGVLRAESGVTLREINRLTVPAGWFVHVTPGTQDVTLGGAIANDVHGKNHHRHGSFGRHVIRFELFRSDQGSQMCSAADCRDLFLATIGGLGLTGIIRWAEIQLRRIPGAHLLASTVPFHSFREFLDLSKEAEVAREYSVAWFQRVRGSSGTAGIRGLFSAADHCAVPLTAATADYVRTPLAAVPFELPKWAMNRHTCNAFNYVYFHSGKRDRRPRTVSCSSFFYPLDALASWNNLYGRNGFLQHQCVLPMKDIESSFASLMDAAGGTTFFLGVLKVFGDAPAAGLLSFARPGVTIAMDFRNEGEVTMKLFSRLNACAAAAGGAVYAAKDATMSAAVFEAGYPDWKRFSQFRDPKISSNFWRRVSGGEAQ